MTGPGRRSAFALSEGNSEYLELSAGGALQIVAGRHRVRGLVSGTLRRASGEKVAEDSSAFFQPLLDDYTDSRAYATASGRVNEGRSRRTPVRPPGNGGSVTTVSV